MINCNDDLIFNVFCVTMFLYIELRHLYASKNVNCSSVNGLCVKLFLFY